jgi:hypothetical protein
LGISTTAGRAQAARPIHDRLAYLGRIFAVYLFPRRGPLTFWYETPEINEAAWGPGLGEYYMLFRGKADYSGPFDEVGVPQLDYRGDIGRQYNPIAIAQYGLANFNKHARTGESARRAKCLCAGNWLVQRLETNSAGLRVWNHHFDWAYRERLIAPWYSGLAQGQGLSLLVRLAVMTGEEAYAEAAVAAFQPFTRNIGCGGVVFRENSGLPWIEEYLVDPPSHILNGFIWGLWGVYDFAQWSGDGGALDLWRECVDTLARNLPQYDTGQWSLYELPVGGPPMLASPYYHRLHIVQLRVMFRLTGNEVFHEYAQRWAGFMRNPILRGQALLRKIWFKLRYY